MKPVILFFAAIMCSSFSFGQNIKLVKDIVPGNDGSYPQIFCTLNNGKVLLSAGNGFFDRYLYISDGVEDGSGTYIINAKAWNAAISLGVKYVFRNNKLFIPMCPSSGCKLWVSDGTDSGTHVVKDINPGYFDVSSEAELMPYNNRVCFIAESIPQGKGIWITDGTETGTYALKAIDNFLPLQITFAHAEAFGKLYFGIDDTLWSTDGTPQGTVPVPGITLPPQYIIQGLFYYKNKNQLFISGNVGNTPKTYSYDPVNGMSLLNISGGGFYEIGGKLFFYNPDTTNGLELWITDGTGAGTMLLKDIYPGKTGSDPMMQGELNGKLVFTARNPVIGRELWISDGTNAGTVNIDDIWQGPNDGIYYYGGLYNHIDNGKFYFAADDGNYVDLYVTDGTKQGTTCINNGTGSRFKRDIGSIHAQNNRVWMGYEYGPVDVELTLYGEPVLGGIQDNDNKSRSVKIYPNPSNGRFTIEPNNIHFKYGSVQVVDMMGKLVYKQDMDGNEDKLFVDLQGKPPGLYNIIVQTDNDVMTYKVSVEK